MNLHGTILVKLKSFLISPYFLVSVMAVLLLYQVYQNQLLVQNQGPTFMSPMLERPLLIGEYVQLHELQAVGGGAFDVEELEDTQTLLIFFSTTCPFCEMDTPLWLELYDRASLSGLSVVAVTPEDDREALLAYAEEHSLEFPIAMDPNLQWYDALNVRVTPTKVLLDSQNRVVQIWEGVTTRSSPLAEVGALFGWFGVEPQSLPKRQEPSSASPLEN